MKIFVTATTVFLVFSCQNQSAESIVVEEEVETDSTFFDYSQLDKETFDTLKYLEDSDVIIEGAVGAAGITPKIYFTQWNFIKGMSVQEADLLYEHPNPQIRGLAISGLYFQCDTNFGAKFISSFDPKNTRQIYSQSGCMSRPYSNFEYFDLVTPSMDEMKNDTRRFSPEEIKIIDSLRIVLDSLE